ncbi:MAG: hypothetical protein Q7U10_08440 [Thermodesulfovibrionia bacterium]|nr:hypothetical protein [Thermodesulfovibrionia bacterium]
MRWSWITVVFFGVILSGCATPGIDEVRLKQSEMELRAEFREQLDAARQELRQEIKNENQGLKSEIQGSSDGLQTGMAELRSLHDKDNVELQKEIFNNKRMIEDQAKRIYLIESIVTAKAAAPKHVEEEGLVTYIDGINISISLGSGDKVKPGDVFGIYKKGKKIASGKAIKVDTNSSEAMVISKKDEISVGDSVKPE